MKNNRPQPIWNNYYDIISFNIGGCSCISLSDAINFSKAASFGSAEDITMSFWGMGHPRFVNVKESLAQNSLIYYKEEEINWKPTPVEEYEP